MTNFLRYTAVTLPSRFLYVPRTTVTSSSLRTGIERTLCFERSSELSAHDMMRLRSREVAVKCALRLFRRDEETVGLNFIVCDLCAEEGGERVRRVVVASLISAS